jgi:cystathionine beta-lyase/cystathionine gamma-synthase
VQTRLVHSGRSLSSRGGRAVNPPLVRASTVVFQDTAVTAANMQRARSVTDWGARGPVVRLHVGLEDPADLIADLGRGFAVL